MFQKISIIFAVVLVVAVCVTAAVYRYTSGKTVDSLRSKLDELGISLSAAEKSNIELERIRSELLSENQQLGIALARSNGKLAELKTEIDGALVSISATEETAGSISDIIAECREIVVRLRDIYSRLEE